MSAYYNAINAKDYATAWRLGGSNLSPSYASFVQGFADTAYDGIQILNAATDSVTLRLDAVQTDGTTKVFEGTYTVNHGVIVGAAVHAVAGSQPGGGTSSASRLYKDCTDAHQHGAYSIPRGQPGYENRLDRDHDGLACEPHEG
ncbi:MAG TPA: excalibur calcium-binding domain-containing protein [Streptomyces sp.]